MWYNQTEVATKTELEKVKGMIDVSARLVGTYLVNNTSSYTIPVDFDYCTIRSIYFDDIYYGNNTSRPYCRDNVNIVRNGQVYIITTIEHKGSGYTYTSDSVVASSSGNVINFNKVIFYGTIEAYKYQ